MEKQKQTKPKSVKNKPPQKKEDDKTKNKKAENKNCVVLMNGFGKATHVDKVMRNLEQIFVNSSIVNKNNTITKNTKNIKNPITLIKEGYKDNRIVIKRPKRNDGSVDSLHYEYIIGCHVRKSLCKMLPNFMKVYGYINKDNDEYLLLQRIKPGTTLRELVKDKPVPEFSSIRSMDLLSIVLQILCALQVAQNVIDFVHYDLHFGNIIIKEDKDSPQNIIYTYNDKHNTKHQLKIPVYKNRIGVIIDYGRAHTSKSEDFFNKNEQCFEPYKFLLDKKRIPNTVDIRTFDGIYDTKRFCKILDTYLDDPDSFSEDLYMNIEEPHDVIKKLIKKFHP